MAPTYLDTLASFTSFLTAYTHTLLYLRALYPRTSFANTRFHNASVWQSRHPLVCEWIRDAVSAVREDLLLGTVSRIAIVVFTLSGNGRTGAAAIMERYMLDVSEFPVVGRSQRNMEIEWESSVAHKDPEHEEQLVDVDLSEQFRAAFIALTARTAKLLPLPENCSFNISMELKDDACVGAPIRHAQPWIPVQPSLQKTGRKATVRDEEKEGEQAHGKAHVQGGDLGGYKVTPLRSVEAGVFKFETWVEETRAKFAKQTGSSSTTKTSFASPLE